MLAQQSRKASGTLPSHLTPISHLLSSFPASISWAPPPHLPISCPGPGQRPPFWDFSAQLGPWKPLEHWTEPSLLLHEVSTPRLQAVAGPRGGVGASLKGSPQATSSRHHLSVSSLQLTGPTPPPLGCLAPSSGGQSAVEVSPLTWARLFLDELEEQAHCSLKYQPLKIQVTISA